MATGSVGGSKSEHQVAGKYRLVRKVGSGSFGDIYLGVNIANGEVNREYVTYFNNNLLILFCGEISWIELLLGSCSENGVGQSKTSPAIV